MLFCFEPLKLHLIKFHLKWNSSSILSVCWTYTHTHTHVWWESLGFYLASPPDELASISKEQVILKEVQTPCWCSLNSSFDSHNIYKTWSASDASRSLSGGRQEKAARLYPRRHRATDRTWICSVRWGSAHIVVFMYSGLHRGLSLMCGVWAVRSDGDMLLYCSGSVLQHIRFER